MSDPTWHGYPQHPDAHPERPWWRGGRTDDGALYLRRADGHEEIVARMLMEHGSSAACIAAYDAAHPLPCPPPMCGQVWVWPGEHKARLVVAVFDGDPVFIGWTFSHSLNQAVALPRRGADMAGAVLVAGPGAPWAPMGETDG